MSKSTPQNLTRTFKDRSIGICRKAAQLHAIDSSIRISIIIEKPGQQPFVFSCEEQGFQWPTFMEQYVRSIISSWDATNKATVGTSSGANRETTVPFRIFEWGPFKGASEGSEVISITLLFTTATDTRIKPCTRGKEERGWFGWSRTMESSGISYTTW